MPRNPVNVPCNGCTACCKNELVTLHPEDGDVIENYQTRVVVHPFQNRMVHVLLHKPNGDCMYLGTNGCTIYDRAPAVCKSFDCRAMYRMMNKRQRREAMKDSVLRDRIIAGRERQ